MEADSENTIKRLRKDLAKTPRLPDGAVVRVEKEGSRGVTLTYAVIWIAATQRWYPSGGLVSPMPHRQFLEWAAEAGSVEVAVDWEKL